MARRQSICFLSLGLCWVPLELARLPGGGRFLFGLELCDRCIRFLVASTTYPRQRDITLERGAGGAQDSGLVIGDPSAKKKAKDERRKETASSLCKRRWAARVLREAGCGRPSFCARFDVKLPIH